MKALQFSATIIYDCYNFSNFLNCTFSEIAKIIVGTFYMLECHYPLAIGLKISVTFTENNKTCQNLHSYILSFALKNLWDIQKNLFYWKIFCLKWNSRNFSDFSCHFCFLILRICSFGVKKAKDLISSKAMSPTNLFSYIPQVIFRLWKISSRNYGQSRPVEVRNTHSDYLLDEKMPSMSAVISAGVFNGVHP